MHKINILPLVRDHFAFSVNVLATVLLRKPGKCFHEIRSRLVNLK